MRRFASALILAWLLGLTMALPGISYATEQASDRPLGEPRPDSALVYFIRHGAFMGGATDARIFCDDRLVAVLPNGNYSFAHVPPGTHLVWVRAGVGGTKPLPFDFACGQTYYIGFKLTSPWSPSLMPPADGLVAVAKAKCYHALDDNDRRKGEESVAKYWPELKEKFGAAFAQSESVGYVPPASTEGMVRVPMGTRIHAELRENLSSDFNKPGDPVWMRVTDSVQIDGAVLVNKGAIIRAAVRGVRRAASLGRGGRLDLTAASVVTADGTVCALVGQAASAGANASLLGSYLLSGFGFAPGVIAGALTRGHADVHPVGEIVDVFTRQDIWISSGSPKPVETAVPPARDSLLHIVPPDSVTFDLAKSQFPMTVKLTVGDAQSVTAVDLVAVDGASMPRPVSAQAVSKSSKGFDAEFAGWDICRYLPAGASNVTLTLRITGADGSYGFGDVTIRLGWAPWPGVWRHGQISPKG